MNTFCVKCRKDTENIDPKIVTLRIQNNLKTVKQKITIPGTGDFQNKLCRLWNVKKEKRKKGNGIQKLDNLKQIYDAKIPSF